MAVVFEPSKELTGGAWYVEGNLDTEFIKILKGMRVKSLGKTEGCYSGGNFRVYK